MAKHLNVNLSFTADTGQAAQQIKSLQQQLQKLVNTTGINQGIGFTKEIQQATQDAANLKIALENATNVKTGKLDLGAFNQQLKASGKNISDYAASLNSLGPEGQKAFASLAQSITMAEVPIKRANTWLTEMGTTIKNAARWQISSSIIHGFMGAVQSAYGYAQNLNESLNNIRIVTGQNTDQMAKFAEQANKTAKSLSTSTLNYTDAALIYYQQGLSDQEVQERTDVTIKLANVSRQSAEEVSDQLTAVWNNFDDGSRSLESYVDVMTALGATTASSSEEISTGLEKFAAVADTVGLSFDYAAAALATVTATTRQSADTVGTAFRTLFSRMEGLKLGETLDDGTDLNKYSQAMASIGVNIKDVNGDIKDMDQILDETAAAWQNLSKDQQIALAQTVGGVRQYTNFIALMDSWDFMEENLATAADAEGTLQEQADIYAESWEAARKRVQAAMQSIYQDLLKDDVFIFITNGFEKIITAVDNTIDSMGGLKGVLSTVGVLMTTVFGNAISNQIQNMIYNIKLMSSSGREAIAQLRAQANDELVRQMQSQNTPEALASANVFKAQGELQNELLAKSDELIAKNTQLTSVEQQQAQIMLDMVNASGQQVINLTKQQTIEERMTKAQNVKLQSQFKSLAKTNGVQDFDNTQDAINKFNGLFKSFSINTRIGEIFGEINTQFENTKNNLPEFRQYLQDIANQVPEVAARLEKLKIPFSNLDSVKESDMQTYMQQIMDYSGKASMKAEEALSNLKTLWSDAGGNVQGFNAATVEYQRAIESGAKHTTALTAAQQVLKKNIDSTRQSIKQFSGEMKTGTDAVLAIGQGFFSLSQVGNTIQGLFNTIGDDSLSMGQKIMSVTGSIGMLLPALVQLKKVASTTFNIFGGISGGWLFAAGAAIAGIAAIIHKVNEELYKNSPEGQLEAQKKSADELASSADKVRQNFNNIKSDFDNYSNILTTLDTCKEHTDEWAQSLIEAKNVYDDLSNKYGDFIDLYETETGNFAKTLNPNTGIFEFSDDFIDWTQQHQQALMSAQTVAQQDLSRQTEAVQISVDKGDIGEQMRSILGSVYGETSDVTGQAIVGLMQNDTFINGLLDFFKNNWGDIQDIDIDAFLENINSLISSELENVLLANAGWTGPNAKEAVINDINEKGLASANIPDGFQIVKNDEGIVTDLVLAQERLNQVQELMGDQIKVSLDEQADRWDNLFADINEVNADQLSYDTQESVNGIVTTLLGQLVVNGLADADTVSYLQNSQTSQDAIQHIYDSIKQEVSQQTEEDLWKEYQKANPILQEVEDFNIEDDQLTYELNGETITESVDGIKSTLAALRMIQDADKWINPDTGENILDVSDEDITKNNLISKYKDNLSETQGKVWEDFINSLDADGLIQIQDDLNNLDFTSLESTLISLGMSAEGAEPLVAALAAMLQSLATTDLSTLQTNYKNVHDIIDGLEKDGTITAEEAQNLEAAGIEVKDFFSAMPDGGFKLETSPKELYDYANGIVTQGFQQLQESSQHTLDLINQAQPYTSEDLYYSDQETLDRTRLSAMLELLQQTTSGAEQANQWQEDIDNGNTDILELASAIAEAFKLAEEQNEIQGLQEQAESDNKTATESLENADESDLRHFGYDPEEVADVVDLIDELNDEQKQGIKDLEAQRKIYKETAKDLIDYENAVEEIIDKNEDWIDLQDESNKLFKKGTGYTDDYGKALDDEIIPAMSDMLGVEEDMIDRDFANEHLQDMIDAANDVPGALEKLGDAYAKAFINNELDDNKFAENFEIPPETIAQLESDIDYINSLDEGMTIGENVQVSSQLEAALNQLYNDAYFTAISGGQSVKSAMQTAANAINAIGFNPPEMTWDETIRTVAVQAPPSVTAVITSQDAPIGDGASTTLSSWRYEIAPGATETVTLPELKPADGQGYTASGGGGHTSPRSGGGSRGGGGGGGGGGGSKAKDKKVVEDEQDRYHEIKEVLEDLKRIYDRIQTSKDRAFGKRHLEAIDEEKKAIEDLIEAEQKYVDEAQNYAKSDKAKLDSYGYNINYDEFGRISNYNDVIRQAVERFNNSARSEDDEKAYDEFKEWLDRYEESMDTAEEHIETILDYRNDLYDLDLEKVQYAIELKIDFGQDRLDYLDWVLNRIEEDAFNAGDAIANLGEQASKLQYMINAGRQGINDVLSHAGATASQIDGILNGSMDWNEMANLNLTADDMDAIKEYRDNLMDYTESLWELRQTVFEELTDAWDAWSEKIENNLDLFEHYESLLEYFNDIVDLVGINMLNINREMRQTTQRANFNVQLNQLAAQRKVMEEYRAQEEEYMEHLNEARARGNEYDIQLWESYLNDVQEAAREAEENMMDDWATTLETASDMFDQMVEDVIATYEEQLSGMFGNLEGLQQAFDQQTEIADRYVEDYQKIYDLTKLNRDIQNSIDDNDSIKAKTRLRDLQEEINKLQESDVKMSQYDLDYLRKKYELRLAEIQLEDAQNAKSTVRMSRDSENNWSYVYTANEDAMEDAYQNYEDKLYEMQQLNTEYIKELQNNMLQSQIELADAVRELDRSAYGSDEEYKAALDRLRNYYLGQYDYYADEISKALGNNKTTYDQDWTWYSDLTGYKKSADDEYLDKFEETIYSQITGYRDLEDAQDNFREVTKGMVTGLTQAFQEWQANVELAMQTAGTSTEDFVNTMYESSEQIQDAAADAEDRTVQMAEEMTAALEENMDSVTNWQQTFSDAIEQTIKEIDELIQHINDLIAAQSGLDKNGNTIETPKQEEAPIPEKAEVVQQETTQVEEHPYGDTVSYSGNSPNRYFYTKKGTFHLTGTYKDNYAGSDPDARIIQKAWDSFAVRNGSSAALDGSGKLIMKKLGLASGGYTGTWGDNYGRLAFLHQKELVLNPEDTQNMLSAVDVVRNIAHMIDISALSSLAGLGGLSAAPVDTTSQELEQNVHITAEFPNAVDHNEIYQALESLPNMASQFAQRKNK